MSNCRGGLSGAPTGPELGMRLALVDAHSATDEQLLDLVAAQARQLAYQQGQLWRALAELAVRDPFPNLPPGAALTPEQIFESAVDELRAQLRWTRPAARRELALAEAVAALPRVAEALGAGLIDRARAIVLVDGCIELTDAQAEALLDQVLPTAGKVTTGRLADQVRLAAFALDPAWAERRYRTAIRERKVVGYLNRDGTATLTGQNLPADDTAAAAARVDALAAAAKRAGAAASTDHLRAHLFLALLDGRYHGMSEAAIIADLQAVFRKPTEPERDDRAVARAREAACQNPRAGERAGSKDAGSRDAGSKDAGSKAARPEAARSEAAGSDAAGSDAAGSDAAGSKGAGPDAAGSEAAGPVGPTGPSDIAGAVRGVHLRVGLATLLGLDEAPGEIAGWGPVPASVARRIAAGQHRGEWRYAIVDVGGQLLFDGVARRRPHRRRPTARIADPATAPARRGIVELHVPAALLTDLAVAGARPDWAELVADLAGQYARQRPIAQDPAARFAGRPLRRRTQTLFQRCLFPGCRRPATECELDHRLDYARSGVTDEQNLQPCCRHDHALKTSRGWRLVRRDANTFVWISPLGRRHVVTRAPVVPPLPAPLPREQPPEYRILDDPNPPPTFQPLTRRGRPLDAPRPAEPVRSGRPVHSDPDPPPF